MQQRSSSTSSRSVSLEKRQRRVVGCRTRSVLSRNRPLTLLAVLGVLWTSGVFHHTDNFDTALSSSSGLCHARPWWSFPVACAQFARGRARLRTATTIEEELANSSTTTDTTLGRNVNANQYVYQPPSNRNPNTLQQILSKAGNKALGGGIPGMVAGVVQVLSLMWLRTIINYQCRYGTTFRDAWVTLYKDGGIARFYKGMGFALLQTPLSRFGSTAANDGIQALMGALRATRAWGPGRTTVLAALVVGMWRMAIMPLDTCKTVLQVDSAQGFAIMWRKVKAGNIGVLYQGAAAMAVAAMMGHYPWFFTYNTLSQSLLVESLISSSLLRNAVIGVIASIVSDTVVNSMRVIKTMKQTMGTKHHGGLGYVDTVRLVLATDGWRGLFGRGLQTRIIANGLQSLVFTVIWRGLAEYWKRKSEGRIPTESTG